MASSSQAAVPESGTEVLREAHPTSRNRCGCADGGLEPRARRPGAPWGGHGREEEAARVLDSGGLQRTEDPCAPARHLLPPTGPTRASRDLALGPQRGEEPANTPELLARRIQVHLNLQQLLPQREECILGKSNQLRFILQHCGTLRKAQVQERNGEVVKQKA